ncbi:uncharacterized protein LOC111019523 [Momordica charantia]|uniref:Uncharacterized protein LOC111019523 n=1 Tax=Momordica charantia TaxID=3673 RepID=A0A6J1DDJ7_MOMCH|nr:uncharacterized protein LOC111019523 [Momordica charantia]
MAYPLPPKMKKPDMKPYDNFANPIDHIELYEGLMELSAMGDKMKCRAFSVTLKGRARSWYRQLKSKSIALWIQLRKVFINQFSAQHDRKKSDTHLLTIFQEEGESLHEFVGRFVTEKIKVLDCSNDVARMTFMSIINTPNLIQSYALQPKRTYTEAIQRARKYMHAEDVLKYKQLQHQTTTSKHVRARGQSSQSKKSHSGRDDRRKANFDSRPRQECTIPVYDR